MPEVEPETCPYTDEVAEIHCHFTEGFKDVFELNLFTEMEDKMLKLLLDQVILLGGGEYTWTCMDIILPSNANLLLIWLTDVVKCPLKSGMERSIKRFEEKII